MLRVGKDYKMILGCGWHWSPYKARGGRSRTCQYSRCSVRIGSRVWSQRGTGACSTPDQTSVHNLDFSGQGLVNVITGVNFTTSNGTTWRIASSNATDRDRQSALHWTCGHGNVDCSAIQLSQPCYEPDTLVTIASYASNSYYQLNGTSDVACSFSGAGVKVDKSPSTCINTREEMELEFCKESSRLWILAVSSKISDSLLILYSF